MNLAQPTALVTLAALCLLMTALSFVTLPIGTDLTPLSAVGPASLSSPSARAHLTAAVNAASRSPPISAWTRAALHAAVLLVLTLAHLARTHHHHSYLRPISSAQKVRRVLLALHAHALADIFYLFLTGAPIPNLVGFTLGSVPLSFWSLGVLFAAVSFSFYRFVLCGPGERCKNRAFLRLCALFGFFDWAVTVLLPLGGALLLGTLIFGPSGSFVTFVLSAAVVLLRPRVVVNWALRYLRMLASSSPSSRRTFCLVPLLVAPMGVSAMGGDETGAGSDFGWTSLLLPLLELMMAGGAPQRGAVLGANVKPRVKEAIETMRAGAMDLGNSLIIKLLDADDARVLAEEIKVNASLTELSLYDNQIFAAGAQAIAEGLKVNASLTKLDLQLTQDGQDGEKV
jgi:hypothetical protein